jgi:hypothetical protein
MNLIDWVKRIVAEDDLRNQESIQGPERVEAWRDERPVSKEPEQARTEGGGISHELRANLLKNDQRIFRGDLPTRSLRQALTANHTRHVEAGKNWANPKGSPPEPAANVPTEKAEPSEKSNGRWLVAPTEPTRRLFSEQQPAAPAGQGKTPQTPTEKNNAARNAEWDRVRAKIHAEQQEMRAKKRGMTM